MSRQNGCMTEQKCCKITCIIMFISADIYIFGVLYYSHKCSTMRKVNADWYIKQKQEISFPSERYTKSWLWEQLFSDHERWTANLGIPHDVIYTANKQFMPMTSQGLLKQTILRQVILQRNGPVADVRLYVSLRAYGRIGLCGGILFYVCRELRFWLKNRKNG